MQDLKGRTVRGGFARLCGQAANLILRAAFVIILVRLLDPNDFGLVAMVTVITGFYGLFTSAGLSAATVQRATISNDQISTLFWINLLIGTILGLLCLATAPALVAFYGDPRLFWLTVVIAAGFPIGAAGVQHHALLQRHLRYGPLAVIEALSQLAGIAVGIGMAMSGFGYWALVAATIVSPAMSTVGMWLAAAWIPGRPRWKVEINSMLRFGGTITLNSLFSYAAYNSEKMLLGRFWGADALGLYGKAYQLISFPTEYLNSAIGGVAFSALSRLQDDPIRLKRYFLKFYSLAVSITLPMTIFCALFADYIILALLGPKWIGAAPMFRLLAPTVLIFGIINPLYWLLLSIGLQVRSLRIAMVIAPLVITAYLIGLPYGPTGVAFAYSAAMTLWLFPHVAWCLHDTMISPWDLLPPISRPFFSGVIAAIFGLGVRYYFGQSLSPFAILVVGGSVMFVVYSCMLLFVLGQKMFYFDLFSAMKMPSALAPKAATSLF